MDDNAFGARVNWEWITRTRSPGNLRASWKPEASSRIYGVVQPCFILSSRFLRAVRTYIRCRPDRGFWYFELDQCLSVSRRNSNAGSTNCILSKSKSPFNVKIFNVKNNINASSNLNSSCVGTEHIGCICILTFRFFRMDPFQNIEIIVRNYN